MVLAAASAMGSLCRPCRLFKEASLLVLCPHHLKLLRVSRCALGLGGVALVDAVRPELGGELCPKFKVLYVVI